MPKTKIEVTVSNPSKKTIAGMRKISSEPAACRHCYYYIEKRRLFDAEAFSPQDSSVPNEKTTDSFLTDYCCCSHQAAKKARVTCNGRWVYDHE